MKRIFKTSIHPTVSLHNCNNLSMLLNMREKHLNFVATIQMYQHPTKKYKRKRKTKNYTLAAKDKYKILGMSIVIKS